MKLQLTTIGFLLLFGALNSQASNPSASKSEGAKYEHRMESSRFNVGPGEHFEVQGPFQRFVGENGVILQWTGTKWNVAVSGNSDTLNGIDGTGPGDIWAVGSNGAVRRYDGNAWSDVSSNQNGAIFGVSAAGVNNVWFGAAFHQFKFHKLVLKPLTVAE